MTTRRASTDVEANVTIVTTTETVLATLDVPPPSKPGVRVSVKGWAQVTIGTNGTAVTPRIRRGTAITDTLVGEGNAIQGAAGNNVDVNIAVDDAPPEVGVLQYVLTVQQTAATANGTGLQGQLEAEFDA